MAKIVLDVPEEFKGLVDSWREQLESVKATVERTDGGKAVDYGQIEREASEICRKSEREVHRAIVSALDIDVPTIVIGGVRYNRVGRCEERTGHPLFESLLKAGPRVPARGLFWYQGRLQRGKMAAKAGQLARL